jgi:hypothetical protein
MSNPESKYQKHARKDFIEADSPLIRKIYDLKMKENSLVIFKGSEILHKSSEMDDNERRILLSMVYCDICQEKKNVFNTIYETTKNYVVYGN